MPELVTPGRVVLFVNSELSTSERSLELGDIIVSLSQGAGYSVEETDFNGRPANVSEPNP